MRVILSSDHAVALRILILTREMTDETWDDNPMYEATVQFEGSEYERFCEAIETAVLEVVGKFEKPDEPDK